MVVGTSWFLQIWLGDANGKVARSVTLILLFRFWINSLARIPFVKLQASGRPDLIAELHVAENCALSRNTLLYHENVRLSRSSDGLVASVHRRCDRHALDRELRPLND